ncbi:ferrochelatase [Vibrio sp. HA2012]|uniref:ferrochelatase n=1 Tax=Vibrio sp. HA2012 TaxID=1971595 RepID=UPI000C2BCF08|nr:ferrochelatase [Vibrio sp. HA2012]PJC85487.1 ferrochelatase [Vibrio sp. HA2012]
MEINQGILLVNLGTPDAPTTSAVKRFLSQFLHDRRVVDLSRWIWCPVLHGIVLPRRSSRVAEKYRAVWMDEGSPLLVYSRRQAKILGNRRNIPVALGMTYGNPSVLSGIQALMAEGVTHITVLPLFPQYSGTTTGAVEDALGRALKKLAQKPECRVISSYHHHPLYIKALADSIRRQWAVTGQSDYLLCSYHGIPQRYADNGDIYPQHCEETTRLLASELGLSERQIGMSYQSRFGREEWVKPYTDKRLQALPGEGIRHLDIITPAFSADCLETLEEVAIEYRRLFQTSGGGEYHYIPCLNDDPLHIEMMAALTE